MTIAGVDASSFAVDIVLLDDDSDEARSFHHIVLPGRTPFERARGCKQRLPARSWWEDNGVWLVGFEDPFSHDAHVAKALALICGAFAAQLPPALTAVPKHRANGSGSSQVGTSSRATAPNASS